MAALTIELTEDAVDELLACDERCVWCDDAGWPATAHDGFCDCCGAMGHQRA